MHDPAPFSPRVMAVTALALALIGCGVSRKYLVEERAEAGDMIEAVAHAARARGYEVRVQEGALAKFVLDPEQGAVMTFQVKRRGIMMVVKIDDDRVPPEALDEAFARAEAVGRELMEEARVVHVEFQAEAQARQRAQAAEEERQAAAEAERDAQRAREREANQADLAAFMESNHQRSQANRASIDEPASSGGDEPGAAPSNPGGASAHCCVNGAFYACPDAAAVDRCVGRFTRCISGCGMSCMEQCLQSDPPDPGACQRDAGRDGEC